MSAPLHRLELGYNQPHDRLILTLYAQDFSEYLFWVTRRGVKVLWSVLIQLMQADQKSHVQHARESQQFAEKIQQEKGQRQPIADMLSNKMSKRPFGDEPLLLAKLMGKPGENGTFQMRLEDVQGRWIEFGGDTSVLMALCQLILEAMKQAEWDLNLELPVTTQQKPQELE